MEKETELTLMVFGDLNDCCLEALKQLVLFAKSLPTTLPVVGSGLLALLPARRP